MAVLTGIVLVLLAGGFGMNSLMQAGGYLTPEGLALLANLLHSIFFTAFPAYTHNT